MPRNRKKPVVEVRVVPWGDGRWGVAGTLDRSRSHFAYPVGTKEAAQALAVSLNLSLADEQQKEAVEG
jgi:hypothetical protein